VSHAPFFQIFVVAAVVMGLSHTIAKEKLFARVRKILGGNDTFRGYLLSCPYCNSHWLAFIFVPLTKTYVIEANPDWGAAGLALRWFVSMVFITVSAAFLRIAFYFVDESQGLVRREIVKTEAETRMAQRAVDEDDTRLSTH